MPQERICGMRPEKRRRVHQLWPRGRVTRLVHHLAESMAGFFDGPVD
jgi:hypothetical protein